MKIEDMKNLKLGDVVIDLEMTYRKKYDVKCVVKEISTEYNRITLMALNDIDYVHYPHNFYFDEKGSQKIGDKVLGNVIVDVFNKIVENQISYETAVRLHNKKSKK